MRQTYRILAFVGLLAVVSSPSIAEQRTTTPFDPSSITPNATVNGLLEGMKSRTMPGNVLPGVPGGSLGITELIGYVGPSTAETLRLYWDLSLSRYWEIPRNAILGQIPGGSPNDPLTILVPRDAPIITGSSMPAEAVVVQRAILDGNIPFEGPGIGPGRPLPGGPSTISDPFYDFARGVSHGLARACLRGSAGACGVVGAGVGIGLVGRQLQK